MIDNVARRLPKFSVVIPLYNKALYIGRALRSVLAQTITDLELIVIDDGSTDDGCNIVKTFTDDRIRLTRQENRGVSAARNRGIDEAKTDLIAFLDADDEWLPEFLETVIRLRDRNPEAGAYATAYEIQERNGDVYSPKYKHIPPAPWEGIIPNYLRSVLAVPIVCSSAVAVPKHVFSDVGGFPLGEYLGEDGDMWLRIALKYPIAFSSRINAIYHKDAHGRACFNRLIRCEYRLIKTGCDAINNDVVPQHMLPYLEKYVAKYKINSASQCILAGERQIAKKILATCKTKQYYMRKLWWRVWAMIPTWVTSCAWYIKRKLFGRPVDKRGRIL